MQTFVWIAALAVVGGVLILSPSTTEAGCFEAWSRCTGWSSGATDILWKTCAGRCRKCMGRETGSCVAITNGECGATQQCQCSGGNVPRSTSWRDRLTCRFGL